MVGTSCRRKKKENSHNCIFFARLLQRSFTLIVPHHHLVDFLQNRRRFSTFLSGGKICALTSQNRPTSSAVELPRGLATLHPPLGHDTGQCQQPDWEHVDVSVALTSTCASFLFFFLIRHQFQPGPWMTLLYNTCSC